jgi:23S rRNA (guanosine2251-2'-O)-methyltransferase
MRQESQSPYQMIYGIHPVGETLKSGHLKTERIFVGTRNPNPALQTVMDLAHREGVPITFAPREELDRMARGGVHQNVVGVVEEFPYADLDTVLSRQKEKGGKALFLILDGIQDPQNLGSLIRTAVGSGAHGVILPKDRAAGITPSVIKASAGATAHFPIVRVVNIADTIERLKKAGIWVYGAEGEAKDPIYDLDLAIDLAIVIGSEGKGIRPLVRKRCDRLFSIPMAGPISSFNASVSGGIVLYEVMRQRRKVKSPVHNGRT